MSETEKGAAEGGRLHAAVHGRVQGVNFRAYTSRKATELGLTGWVRNASDGTVETIAEGDHRRLYAFLEFLHEGSPSSVVTQVVSEWEEPSHEFTDFRIRYF